MVNLPEEWTGGSAYLRSIREADFLLPLELLFPDLARDRVAAFYRHLTLYRGLSPRRENQAVIPTEVAAAELARGFPPGLYRKRHRFMTDGLMLGSEEAVRCKLEELTEAGIYRRKRNTAAHLNGLFHTIREQRCHSRW